MTDTGRISFGRWMAGTSVIVIVGSLVAVAMLGRWDVATEVLAPTNGLLAAGFGALAWTVLPKQPRNGAVWTYAWTSFFGAVYLGLLLVMVLTSPAAALDTFDGPDMSAVPFIAQLAISIMIWAWVPILTLPLTLGLLLFPDGHLPSPRWRWVAWLTLGTLAVSIASLQVLFSPWSSVPLDTYDTPLGQVVESLLVTLTVIGLVCVASLIVRYRRGSSLLRRQIRWIAVGGLLFLLGDAFVVAEAGGFTISGDVATTLIYLIPTVLLVGSFWIAITRYRLYDIDVVISKSLTFGALAVFITGVYALVVVGIGSLVGGGDEPSLALSIAAVAIVAVAFEPLRRRLQHWANRLVYGKRATPYEVLSGATTRLSQASDPDAALAEITQLVVDGTGASRAVVWLAIGGSMVPHAATPQTVLTELVPLDGVEEALDGIPGDRCVAVRHRGEVLGALSITKPHGESVTGPDERMLGDVAAGAGGLLRNIALNAALVDRAEQLRVSRRRLVAAQDAERHRLERDLHDGAQQQVVALKVKLGVARTLAEREGAAPVAALVASLADTTQEAVDAMRAVAHGIYPPLLESEGLEAALNAAKRTVPIPISIAVANALPRYDRQVEESVYFCVLGAINAGVDAGATTIAVSVVGSEGSVHFSIGGDTRIGELVTLADRVDALGGDLEVVSEDGEFEVTGRLVTVASAVEFT